jgi:hypothetical protein
MGRLVTKRDQRNEDADSRGNPTTLTPRSASRTLAPYTTSFRAKAGF